jgi:hypothetical protein
MVSALQDDTGCLTEAGLEALEQAQPGQAPQALARHLAECARCQNRVLTRAGGEGLTRLPPATTRRLWLGTAIVLVIMLVALLSLLATLSWLRSAPE